MAKKKSEELTPRQMRAAYLLGTGKGPSATSRELKIAPNTITAWLRIPQFCEVRDRVCKEYIESVVPEAVGVFVEQIRDEAGRDKKGWLKQSAAGRLIALADTQRERADGGISIVVDAEMPTPGMPDPPKSDGDGE